jgi:hypothetical protein
LAVLQYELLHSDDKWSKTLGLHVVSCFLLICAGEASADSYFDNASTKEIVEVYRATDENCRGGSGGELTSAWCGTRELIAEYLENQRNYCLGKKGQASFEHVWHSCNKDSLRGE